MMMLLWLNMVVVIWCFVDDLKAHLIFVLFLEVDFFHGSQLKNKSLLNSRCKWNMFRLFYSHLMQFRYGVYLKIWEKTK